MNKHTKGHAAYRQAGFTLIELLVVVVVIAIFSGLSVLYYNNFNEQKKLESDIERFKSVFELARNKSLSGDKSSCTGLNDLQPFEIDYIAGKSGYFTLNNDCGTPSQIGKYRLNGNDVFTTSGTIQFKIAQPGIASAQSIIMQNTMTNKCSTLTIDISGIINQSGFVSCSSDIP